MSARLIIGDSLTVLRTMPDNSVDLVLTSPPYLALRSYLPKDDPNKAREMGSEGTPAAFIDALLDVTEELRRVLAPHGSLCIELGDTYAGSSNDGGPQGPGVSGDGGARWRDREAGTINDQPRKGTGWPRAKSLTLIPESYRWALAYGRNPFTGRETEPWVVRNVIRHFRPNPPVGALGDKVRPATSEWVVACADRSRYFDLDAVRTESTMTPQRRYVSRGGPKNAGHRDGGGYAQLSDEPTTFGHPAGAPPLDWWADDDLEWRDAAGFIEPTAPFSGWARTSRRIPVARDAADGDTERTTSPDCPEHGSPGQPGPTPVGGGHGTEDRVTRTERTDTRPALEQLPGFAPTAPPLDGSTEGHSSSSPVPPCAPAAMPRSTASSRTDPAPATSPVGTPSAETTDRTGGTSGSPSSAALHHDTPESSTSARSSLSSPSSRTDESTDGTGTSEEDGACTCSYWTTTTETTSHYATFSPRVVARLIQPMCPPRVCRTCGVPTRREETVPCGHDDYRNGVVLDCFGGSGTTASVASGHGRDCLLIDLDERNAELAQQRCGMFLDVARYADDGSHVPDWLGSPRLGSPS